MNAQLQITLKVIEHIKRDADNEQVRGEVDFGCTSPAQMDSLVYQRLQELSESLDMSRARGEDCVPGFDELQAEVDRLMDASPWTLHPDERLVRKDEAGSDSIISP
jgi:hypothetical protein